MTYMDMDDDLNCDYVQAEDYSQDLGDLRVANLKMRDDIKSLETSNSHLWRMLGELHDKLETTKENEMAGYKEGTHKLHTLKGDRYVNVDVVQMKNGDWKWYNEDKGWSKSYNASDIALASACQTFLAKPLTPSK